MGKKLNGHDHKERVLRAIRICKCTATGFFLRAAEVEKPPVGFDNTAAAETFTNAVNGGLKYEAPKHLLIFADDIIAHRRPCEYFERAGKMK